MFCEAYRKPLTDAAAAGSAIEETLQSHLVRCEACAAAFAQEQALFAAMDVGLSHLVNTQAPPSLLPRAREAVSRERVPSRGLLQSWLWMPAASAAALMLAALLPYVFPPSPVADPSVLVQLPPSSTGTCATPLSGPQGRAFRQQRARGSRTGRRRSGSGQVRCSAAKAIGPCALVVGPWQSKAPGD